MWCRTVASVRGVNIKAVMVFLISTYFASARPKSEAAARRRDPFIVSECHLSCEQNRVAYKNNCSRIYAVLDCHQIVDHSPLLPNYGLPSFFARI